MQKTVAIAAALFLASGAAVFAAEVEGTVKLFDPVTRMVTLETGETFVVPDEAVDQPITTGSRVRIVHEEKSTDAVEVTLLD